MAISGAFRIPTDVSRLTEPPGPVQVKTNVCVEYKGAVFSDPENDLLPLHPPDALQEVVLEDDHRRVAPSPYLTRPEAVLKVKVGDDGFVVTVGGG